MNRGAVVVPTDIPEKIAASSQHHGWVGGFEMKGEKVYILLSAALGKEEFISEAFSRLSSHKAGHILAGQYKEQLLEWYMVPRGFAKRFGSPLTMPFEGFANLMPVEFGEDERIVLAVESTEADPEILPIRLVCKEDNVLSWPVDVIRVGAKPEPFARMAQEIVHVLSSKAVIIAGLGSGGAEIALNLACAGVGNLTLIDYDRINPENYIRFIAGRTDLGRRKIDIVCSAITDRDLSPKITRHAFNIVSDADRFRGVLSQGADLVICATDSVASRRTVNAAAVVLQMPCIIAGTLNDGRMGEVLHVLPYQSPCYECVRMELGSVLEPPEIDDRAATPYVGSEEAALGSTALRSDITLVASLACRVALHELAPQQFPGFPTNYILWGREADHAWADPFHFETPFSTNYVRVDRRKDCPLCGPPPPELLGVDVREAANEILRGIVDN
jgi:molybdopterin/thiamine biosynthesis adenylyltransferase